MLEEGSVFESLRDRAVNGGFAPNQRLKPQDLAKDYACSATTIREALFRLSTERLVVFHDKRGFRLTPQSPELQHDLTQFRILLECEGGCRSIRHGGIAWEARLSAAHHKLSHIESRVRSGPETPDLLSLWTVAEHEFHTTLIDACGSETLIQTHTMIYRRFRQQLITSDKEFVFVSENIEQHRGILDAALAHDEGLIRHRITDHLARNLLHPVSDTVRKSA